MTAALIGALAAAVCYGSASVLQAIGVRRIAATAGPGAGRSGLAALLRALGRQWLYLAGLALDGIGFAASVLALRTLPLFAVQAAVASSVAVTALLAHWILGVRLLRAELVAMVTLGAGLILLALAAQPERVAAPSTAWRLLLVAGVGLVSVMGLAAAGSRPRYASAACATVAGLAFTGVGVAARVLVVPHPLWRLLVSPVALALAGYGILGLLLYAAALDRGSVTTATAILFAVETVVPATLGLAWLGDSARPGYAGAAAAGFACTVGGALALARHGNAQTPAAQES